jgi:hypothetical protein
MAPAEPGATRAASPHEPLLERTLGARVFDLGDDLLLYLPREQVVVTLNGAARAVWEACDGCKSMGEIAAELARSLDSDPDLLAPDVARTVAALVDRGLLREPHEHAAGTEENSLLIAFGGSTVAVECGDPALSLGIRHRFAHMLALRGDPMAIVSCLYHDDGSVRILRDGRSRRREAKSTTVERSVEGEIIQTFLVARPDLLWFHAGAAGLGGAGVIVAGAAGSGKSTIVTALCARGAGYLSDEIVAWDPFRHTVHAFPLAPRVRAPQDRLLAAEEVHRLARSEVAIDSELLVREPLPIAAVLFPEFAPDALESLELCSPATAAARLLANCQDFERQGELAVRSVTRLVSSVPAFVLRFRRGEIAAQRISERLLARGEPAHRSSATR